MKRIVALFLVLVLTAALFSGCQLVRKSSGKPTIVVTIFPIYDWVRNVLGDEAENFELVLLMQNGSDLHSFNPGLSDMQKIRNADLFIYVGGESDAWVQGALAEAGKEAVEARGRGGRHGIIGQRPVRAGNEDEQCYEEGELLHSRYLPSSSSSRMLR